MWFFYRPMCLWDETIRTRVFGYLSSSPFLEGFWNDPASAECAIKFIMNFKCRGKIKECSDKNVN